jgi:hypothetical protein
MKPGGSDCHVSKANQAFAVHVTIGILLIFANIRCSNHEFAIADLTEPFNTFCTTQMKSQTDILSPTPLITPVITSVSIIAPIPAQAMVVTLDENSVLFGYVLTGPIFGALIKAIIMSCPDVKKFSDALGSRVLFDRLFQKKRGGISVKRSFQSLFYRFWHFLC